LVTNADPTVAFTVLDWDFTNATTIPPPLYVTSQAVSTTGGTTQNLPLTFANHTSINFQSAVATPTCVRFAYDATENLVDADNNAYVRESQLVVLGTIGG
jgi:hypothetical protein